jgi:hypothetical protein
LIRINAWKATSVPNTESRHRTTFSNYQKMQMRATGNSGNRRFIPMELFELVPAGQAGRMI